MKNLSMLCWLTQLGLSVALPIAGFVLLAVWLQKTFNWGWWVLVAGILLGLVSAVRSFLEILRTMERMTKDKKEEPPASFNDHH